MENIEIKKAKLLDANFKKRTLSALILAPVILSIVFFGGHIFLAMMSIVAAIAVYEWSKMTLSNKQGKVNKMIEPAAVLFSASMVAITGVLGNPALTLWMVLTFCFMIFAFNIANKGASINKFIFGIIYIIFAIEIIVWIRNFAPNGLFNIITLIAATWACDIFALIAGKTIGGPKLAPVISPNKTWAGLLGGAFGSGISLMLLAILFPNMTLANIGAFSYFFIGIILAIFAQGGDLLISIVKRYYNIKDTGNLIPGHGGILDRIDALIMVAIIFGTLVFIFS